MWPCKVLVAIIKHFQINPFRDECGQKIQMGIHLKGSKATLITARTGWFDRADTILAQKTNLK